MHNDKLDQLFQRQVSSKQIYEATLYLENASGSFTYKQEHKRTLDTPMLMASITKLYTTTCVLALAQEGKLSLDDYISQYLDSELLQGLHIYKGVDYADSLKIRHLLFQTSGLPDYYLDGTDSIYKKMLQQDFFYPFADMISKAKSLKPRFAPGTQGKAYYADLNFDLLGKIIEKANSSTLQSAYEKYIFTPLGLTASYLFTSEHKDAPCMYFKDRRLNRPLFLSSCFASGGAVTTARELMIFLKAFWQGDLFNKSIFEELAKSNQLQLSFYPIRYAGGYMKIRAGYPWGAKYTLMGHSGSTGSFAFYCPDKELFIVGDIPQASDPSTAVRLVIRAAIVAQVTN